MPKKQGRKSGGRPVGRKGIGGIKSPEILDVAGAATLLTVSTDTVYELFKSGELPGRKVGRKWITTKSAILRWVEGSFESDAAAWAIEQGDRDALSKALKTGKVRARGQG
jgi:excisionase family DNA binding protein